MCVCVCVCVCTYIYIYIYIYKYIYIHICIDINICICIYILRPFVFSLFSLNNLSFLYSFVDCMPSNERIQQLLEAVSCSFYINGFIEENNCFCVFSFLTQ